MISALDDGVGRILDRVAGLGNADNTIVVFTSDNGGPEVSDADGRCNAPYVGHKRNLYEGGIRLPFMMRWPARLGAGTTYSEMVSTLDLLPTFLAAVGGTDGDASRPFDGVDLLPFVAGEKKGAPHESLYWRSGPNGAMRQGRYKLVFGGDVVRLYDVEQDPAEKNDLATKMADRVATMRTAWDAWNAQMSQARASARTETTTLNGDSFRWHI